MHIISHANVSKP